MAETRPTNIEELTQLARNDADLRQKIAEDPVGTLETFAVVPDTRVYRYTVLALAAALLISLLGSVWLAAGDGDVPDVLIASASGAIGALAGLIRPS